MKDVGTSNVSHVSRKPLQCIDATTSVVRHDVEVTFGNHCSTYYLFSNSLRPSSSVLNDGKIILYSNTRCNQRLVSSIFTNKEQKGNEFH